MKRGTKTLIIIIAAAALIIVGTLMYKHFVTDRIMDRPAASPTGTADGGGMEFDWITDMKQDWVGETSGYENCVVSISDKLVYTKDGKTLYDGGHELDEDTGILTPTDGDKFDEFECFEYHIGKLTGTVSEEDSTYAEFVQKTS